MVVRDGSDCEIGAPCGHRKPFRLASMRDWDALKRDVKPIYTAVNADAVRAALDDIADTRGTRYPTMIRLWRNAWEDSTPVPGLRRRDPHGG